MHSSLIVGINLKGLQSHSGGYLIVFQLSWRNAWYQLEAGILLVSSTYHGFQIPAEGHITYHSLAIRTTPKDNDTCSPCHRNRSFLGFVQRVAVVQIVSEAHR